MDLLNNGRLMGAIDPETWQAPEPDPYADKQGQPAIVALPADPEPLVLTPPVGPAPEEVGE